jgi:hypothetical protein
MAITQEVDKLLTASFIMEVLYLIWFCKCRYGQEK